MQNPTNERLTRRQILTSAAAAVAVSAGRSATATAVSPKPAQIAVTLDLEMSRNFPNWTDTKWDYEKGNLNQQTIEYTVEVCRRVKARGGRVHCFCVGQVLEQEDVSWLTQLSEDGHPIGNHTYDHVNILATEPGTIQYRFRRAPWLISGRKPGQVIRDNIEMTTAALRQRTGIENRGFRTPGGFRNGLKDRPHLQKMLSDC